MIPFFIDRMKFIEDEIRAKENQHPRDDEAINFLGKTYQEVERSLEKEKHEVLTMANRMYEVWTHI